MNTQQRLFDGHVIEHFRAAMGTVDVDQEDIEHFRADGVVVLLVTVSDDGATIKKTKDGGYIRTEKLTPSSMRVIKGELREELIEYFNLADIDPQLALVAVGNMKAPTTAMAPVQTASVATSPVSSSTTNGSMPVVADEVVDEEPEDLDDSEGIVVDDRGVASVVETGEVLSPEALNDPALAAFLAGP